LGGCPRGKKGEEVLTDRTEQQIRWVRGHLQVGADHAKEKPKQGGKRREKNGDKVQWERREGWVQTNWEERRPGKGGEVLKGTAGKEVK